MKKNKKAQKLVDLSAMDDTLRLDIRYATSHNLLQRPVYKQADAFLLGPAARALINVHHSLKRQGYGLVVFDAYRPLKISKLFWESLPADKRKFFSHPEKGSVHNRGMAVDVSLYDLKTGLEVEMPGGFDELNEKSKIYYYGSGPGQRRLRNLLIKEMEKQGFTVSTEEWWHFDYKGWEKCPLMDTDFEEI